MADDPFLNLRQIATPKGNPQNGGNLLYVKSDGKLYTKNSSGVETAVETSLGDVTLAGVQTLTNKTISADNNTLSGIAASSFVLSNGSGNIDGSAAQKVIPAGVVVGTTDAQTLTNKVLSTGTTVGAATTDISGAWTAYTPTVTAGGGTFTTVAGAMRYMQFGKTFIWNCTINITTVGTATGTVNFTLPVAIAAPGLGTVSMIGAGRENAINGKMVEVFRSTGSASIASVLHYDNSSPIVAGASLILSGQHETV